MENPSNRDKAIHQVRCVIDRLVREGSVTSNSDGTKRKIFPVALSPKESEALRNWVIQERASKTIEIGLAYGISALHICEGLLLNKNEDARHLVIDPNQSKGFADSGLQVLEEAGVREIVEHYGEESHFVLPRLLKEGRNFDLGFVDGNHRFDSVFLDLYFLGRLVRKGGIVILDDYKLPGIKRAVSFFVANLDWTIEDVINNHSVVLRTSLHDDKRDFRYFVEF